MKVKYYWLTKTLKWWWQAGNDDIMINDNHTTWRQADKHTCNYYNMHLCRHLNLKQVGKWLKMQTITWACRKTPLCSSKKSHEPPPLHRARPGPVQQSELLISWFCIIMKPGGKINKSEVKFPCCLCAFFESTSSTTPSCRGTRSI